MGGGGKGLVDRQRSEGAIFETPRDNRDKSAAKINSSLYYIAGILNLNKTIGVAKKGGGTAVRSANS